MAALQGVQLGDYHTLKDWGLYLVVGGTTVGEAEVDEHLVKVPGGDRLLNLTKALDGKVHYTQRKITITLKCVKPKKYWPNVQRTLENALQGQWLRCIFDDDPSWYWEGLWKVAPQSRDRWENVFVITGTCNPHKISLTAEAGADWLWDPFNFETDTIYTKPTKVKSL